MTYLLHDLFHAFRQLRRSPGFALAAVLTLALGIGATTAIFSLVDGVLLQPLAYRESARLAVVWERVGYLAKRFPYTGPNPRHFQFFQSQATTFESLTLLQQGSAGVSLGPGDHPRFVGRLLAQSGLLPILGVQPVLGRNFLPEETSPGHENVVILSWNLWQTLFHADPAVLGQSLTVAGTPRQVVGVLPKGFYFPRSNELAPSPTAANRPETEILSPLAIDPTHFGWNSDYGNYIALGRLKPGTTVTQAQSELDTLARDIVRQAPPSSFEAGPGALATYVQPLKQVIVGPATRGLWILFAAILSVLLIACINLANAQLARLVARDREAALRAALGASPWRLLQSALAEVALLSVSGGLLGILLARVAVTRFAALAALAIPRTGAISLNPAVLSLSVLLTVGVMLLFGVLPALRFLRIRPQQALQNTTRTSGSRASRLLRRTLIGGQVFACTTLLLVAGLFARSLLHLLTQDRGFSTANVVTAGVNLQGKAFPDEIRATFDDGVLEKLRAIPTVQSASLVSAMLLQGETWIDSVDRPDAPNDQASLANWRWIGPDYFTTLEQRIVAGRALDARDRTLKNAVISEATAKAVWPGLDPINRTFRHNGTPFTVVGIVADARNNSLHAAPVNMVYLPYWDNPPYGTFFLIRATQDPALLADSIRKAIWSYNPDVTISAIRPLDAQVDDSLAPERIQTTLLASFGAAAFLLAILGIYSTLTYSVQTRTPEIGIRMALGATRRNVYLVTLREAAIPIASGLFLGWLAALVIARIVSALLDGSPTIGLPLSLIVIAAFALASAAATFFPCRRAATIDPMQALRTE